MANLIQLLPDSIANQIAAGEVIQRPASVVKELMENAIDSGADEIRLIVKESGKILIQVVDTGCGMSESDARMSFERHATSKIRSVDDLFSIRTKGFRGEALPSIASVSQVELKTRTQDEEVGSRIKIDGSKVQIQEACACNPGTSISVRNLFFNVPARRKFLKSDTVELRHILDEFQRLVLAHPDIFFSMHHNGEELFHLPLTNLRQRIVNVFGRNSNEKLVPIDEETEIVQISGFVGKPEFARKTRGEQYFFVNNRFIKSPYLNHAVVSAYEDVLQEKTYPLYVLYMEIDPADIDVNVHPTKQEIKFKDERLIYNYIKVSVRHALGQYHITPSLDFETESLWREKSQDVNPNFSPSDSEREKSNKENWSRLFEGIADIGESEESVLVSSKMGEADTSTLFKEESKNPYQIHKQFIIHQIKSGFIIIDQQHAHERILYERFLKSMTDKIEISKRELFPQHIELSPADQSLIIEVLDEINALGFDIQAFGKEGFVIHAYPAFIDEGVNIPVLIDSLLDNLKANRDLKSAQRERIAKSLALSSAAKRGHELNADQMRLLIDQLFACEMPYRSPSGKLCFISFDLDEISNRINTN